MKRCGNMRYFCIKTWLYTVTVAVSLPMIFMNCSASSDSLLNESKTASDSPQSDDTLSTLGAWLSKASTMTVTEETYTGDPLHLQNVSLHVPNTIREIPTESTSLEGFSDFKTQGHLLLAAAVNYVKNQEANYAGISYFSYKFSVLLPFSYKSQKQLSTILDGNSNTVLEIDDYQSIMDVLLDQDQRSNDFTYQRINEYRQKINDDWAGIPEIDDIPWGDRAQYYYYFNDYTYNKSGLLGYTDKLYLHPISNELYNYMKQTVSIFTNAAAFFRDIPEGLARPYDGYGGLLFSKTGKIRSDWHRNGSRFRYTQDVPFCDTDPNAYGSYEGNEYKLRGDGQPDVGYYREVNKKYIALIWDCVQVDRDNTNNIKDYKYRYIMRNIDSDAATLAGWDGLYIRAHLQSYPGIVTRDDRSIVINAYFNETHGFIHFRRENIYLKVASDGTLEYSEEGAVNLPSEDDREAFRTIHSVFRGTAEFLDGPFMEPGTITDE